MKANGCGSFATCLTIASVIIIVLIFLLGLLYYSEMISSGRRLWKLCGRDFTVLIKSLMIPFVFTGFMKIPVLIKILTASQCTQAEHCFCTGQPPFGTGYIHTILHKMAACPLNNPCGNGEAQIKITIVFKIRCLIFKISCASLHGFTLLVSEFSHGGTSAHSTCHQPGFAFKYFE